MTIYNSQKENLIIREYGRNTQNLINHAKTIEDKEKRQIYVEKVVKLIMSMHPYTRNVEDYRMKVWSHVLKMANYELDIELPDNLPDARLKRKPDIIKYPKRSRKLRHYGKNVKTMIEKAKLMTDPEQQKAYIAVIGAFMKMSYKTWNRENVNDEVIAEEFNRIAQGELSIPVGLNIDSLCTTVKKKKTSGNTRNNSKYSNKKNSNKKNSKSKNSKNRNYSNKNSRNKKR